MAVAYDAVSNNTGTFGTSFTHTPSGTPRGVTVTTFASVQTTAVTYGGVAMTEVALSPQTAVFGLLVGQWFLAASIPTGGQTVAITGPSSGTVGAVCVSLTAAANTEVVDTSIVDTSTADPSVNVSLGGRTSFVWLAGVSELNDVSLVTPTAGWTSRFEFDSGASVLLAYTYDTIGTADVAAGFTQTVEDVTYIAAAISEVQTVIVPGASSYYRRLRT